jgi:hypothetical protein
MVTRNLVDRNTTYWDELVACAEVGSNTSTIGQRKEYSPGSLWDINKVTWPSRLGRMEQEIITFANECHGIQCLEWLCQKEPATIGYTDPSKRQRGRPASANRTHLTVTNPDIRPRIWSMLRHRGRLTVSCYMSFTLIINFVTCYPVIDHGILVCCLNCLNSHFRLV